MQEKNKAIFLDRDGTINEDVGYVIDDGMFNMFDFTPAALGGLRELGFKLIIVTNQAGIAKGYFDMEMVQKVHNRLKKELKRNNIELDAIYYCPYHKDGIISEYMKDSTFRKPETGMIERAVREHNIDVTKSFMIGDKLTDIECGKKAGLKTILVLTGYGRIQKRYIKKLNIVPDYIADNLEHAYKIIQGLN